MSFSKVVKSGNQISGRFSPITSILLVLFAIFIGFPLLVGLLRDKKAGKEAFFDAIITSDFERFDELIESEIDINSVDSAGMTALHLSTINLNTVFSRKLIEYGADVNARNNSGNTPLHIALRKYLHEQRLPPEGEYHLFDFEDEDQFIGSGMELINLLLDEKAELNTQDAQGESPFHTACRSHDIELIGRLLNLGADPNLPNKRLSTPFHLACSSSEVDLIRLMVDAGADIHSENNIKQQPIHFAAWWENLEVLKYLIKLGADVNAVAKWNWRPVHAVANRGNLEIYKVLELNGAELNVQTNRGFSCLHIAAFHNYSELVEYILSTGVDLTLLDQTGNTALHSACLRDSLESAILLEKHGFDWNQKNKDDRSPKELAAEFKSLKILEYLESK